ncbi:ectomycorrhiza-regulated protein [Desarmillaria tabescens]|uniref:Ectomycorrhiza-regulated protein n=1 Tax=Armillaria tabescens TaxID=1929756 RepID=A0AA39NI25_ARMTA|nr:ectomycorrhiza-regulated protein [Desarmillaria tabescens]KAK0466042.1 ectomycorrhiza-regulated protein [Desarmillaria tabescens]
MSSFGNNSSDYNMTNSVYSYDLPASAYPVDYQTNSSSTYPPSPPSSMDGTYGSIRKRRSPIASSSLGLDAPTQPRRYVTPSVTSRKEIPAFFMRRRPQSIPSDEEDELTEEPPAAGATDQEKVEYKRRQNTLAARRSRKRKMLYQHELEETVRRLTTEKEIWKTRALTLRQLLQSHGVRCPDFEDA